MRKFLFLDLVQVVLHIQTFKKLSLNKNKKDTKISVRERQAIIQFRKISVKERKAIIQFRKILGRERQAIIQFRAQDL